MFKIIEISKEGLHLNLNRGCLEIRDREDAKLIPLDDIKSLIITGYGQTITTVLLGKLLERKIGITFCNSKFMPEGLLLPEFGNGQLHRRIHLQSKMSEPFKKNIWKEIISKKIFFQAEILKYYKNDDFNLLSLSNKVLSGDSDNKEAQAARKYWPQLFADFRRGDEDNFINIALNYGYIVLRSSVSRALVAQGLHPSFGVFHDNKENNFCLVDDLMEIFRPVVDYKVRSIAEIEAFEVMSPELKRSIVSFIYEDLRITNEEISPLYRCIETFIHSFCTSLEDKSYQLLFPLSIIPVMA